MHSVEEGQATSFKSAGSMIVRVGAADESGSNVITRLAPPGTPVVREPVSMTVHCETVGQEIPASSVEDNDLTTAPLGDAGSNVTTAPFQSLAVHCDTLGQEIDCSVRRKSILYDRDVPPRSGSKVTSRP
jgi:hypothetical protein